MLFFKCLSFSSYVRFGSLWLLLSLGLLALDLSGGGFFSGGGLSRPLLGGVLFQSLLVLAPVKHGPCDFPRIPLQVMTLLGFSREKLEGFAISLDQGAAMTRVDLQTRKCAQFNLHLDFISLF